MAVRGFEKTPPTPPPLLLSGTRYAVDGTRYAVDGTRYAVGGTLPFSATVGGSSMELGERDSVHVHVRARVTQFAKEVGGATIIYCGREQN